jgi:hypothetical protein
VVFPPRTRARRFLLLSRERGGTGGPRRSSFYRL